MTAADIAALHRALCSALNVPVWRLGMTDVTTWQGFLFVLQSLDETNGGPLTPRDVAAVVALMKRQRAEGTPWSLRYAKILRDPETFRDLVLETRKVRRPRPAVERVERVQADGACVLDERDPAAEVDPKAVRETLDRFWQEMGRKR